MHIRNATNNENGLHEFGATIICNNRSKTCTAGGLSKGSIDRVGSSAWAVPSGLFTLGEAFLEDNIIGKAAIHSHTRLSARDDGMHEGLREYSLELGSRLSPRDFRTLSELEPIGGFRRYGLYNEDNSTLTLVKMDEALVPPFNEVELVECETSDKSKATYGNAYRNTQTIEAMRNFIDENTARGKIQITNYKLNDDYAELCEKDCGNKDGKYFLEDYYEPWSTIFSKDGTGCSYEPEPIAF